MNQPSNSFRSSVSAASCVGEQPSNYAFERSREE
jgi:hypothetical protein